MQKTPVSEMKITSKWTRLSNPGGKEYCYVEARYKDGSSIKTKYARFIVMQALGKPLPPGSIVHHVDENSLNDRPNNLILCENQAYHFLLHLRAEALKATGDPNSRKCHRCKQWGIPGDGDMVRYKRGNRLDGDGLTVHISCNNKYAREWHRERRLHN